MTRSGIEFGVRARAIASVSDSRLSSSAFPITHPLTLPRRASETMSPTDATPPEAITRRVVILRNSR